MKLRIADFFRKLVSTDVDPEPKAFDEDDDWLGPEGTPQEAKQPSVALCSPYAAPAQWRAELDKPCYCGLPAIWLDFYDTLEGITAVGTCQHHRGVKRWVHTDDGPVRAYWSPCHMCPSEKEWDTCLGHIVVNDNLHTVIYSGGDDYGYFNGQARWQHGHTRD